MKRWWTLLILATYQCLNAQPEQLVAHFNQDWYLAGEDVYFSVYRTDPDTANWRSTVLHLVVSNDAGAVVRRQRYPLEGNSVNGEVHLPLGWSEGFYYFNFYTLWNLNYAPEQQLTVRLPVYNSLLEPSQRKTVLPSETANNTVPEEVLPVKIVPASDHSILTGSILSFTLSTIDASVEQVSVSVTQLDRQTNAPQLPAPVGEASENSFQAKYAPETGLIIQGEIRALTDGKPQPTDYLGISFVEDRNLRWTNAPGGVFRVAPDPFFGERTLQYFDGNPFHDPLVRVKLTPPVLPELPTTEYRPRRDSTVVAALKLDRRRRELRQLFGQQPERRDPLPFDPNDNFTPQNIYFTKDYIQFESLIDFLEEVTLARMKTERGYAASMKLYNPNLKRHFNGSPVYIVDNYLTFKEEDVLRIDYSDIKSVELFTDLRVLQEQFKLLGANGVVRFTTKSGDLPGSITNAANNYKLEGFHFVKPFQRIPSNPTLGTVPDFQSQLFWQADVPLVPEGTKIEVLTNDLPGIYRMVVGGVDRWGIPFRMYQDFETVIKPDK